jgi:hypothetical protein
MLSLREEIEDKLDISEETSEPEWAMSTTRGGSWFMLASKAAKADINSSNSSSLMGIGENRACS